MYRIGAHDVIQSKPDSERQASPVFSHMQTLGICIKYMIYNIYHINMYSMGMFGRYEWVLEEGKKMI
jgi:hypothetical protein